nr:MAG TPA: hypothetical protein [Caudoviricetes sp.]
MWITPIKWKTSDFLAKNRQKTDNAQTFLALFP